MKIVYYKRIIKIISYCLLFTALTILAGEFFFNYINHRVFFNFLLVLGILLVIEIAATLIKQLNKIMVQVVICLIICFINYGYAEFLFKIDITMIVVPGNFTGNVNILMGIPKTANPIHPINKTLIINVNKDGTFQTSSKYKIDLNSIVIAGRKNHEWDFSKKLFLSNLSLTKVDTLSTNIYKISGKIIAGR